jgi:mannose/cellobiose epimerase-like protein (N-acyl-D-glucosamine 2-epimerase family)
LSQADKVMTVNRELSQRLLIFADKVGVNPATGLVYEQVSLEGVVTQPTHRLWAQTEVLKAWLVRTDVSEPEREAGILKSEDNLLRYYFNHKPMGSWGDRLDMDGRAHDGPILSSSMYHIMLCVTELWAWRSNREQKK